MKTVTFTPFGAMLDSKILNYYAHYDPAYQYIETDEVDDGVILNIAFRIFNTWDESEMAAKKIRRITNKTTHSLSIGDIVTINESVYICKSDAWELLKFTTPINWRDIAKQ
jgi:hypothetical protein